MKSFFENLFGKKVEGKIPELEKLGLYKKGDVIGGKYEVLGNPFPRCVIMVNLSNVKKYLFEIVQGVRLLVESQKAWRG